MFGEYECMPAERGCGQRERGTVTLSRHAGIAELSELDDEVEDGGGRRRQGS